MNRKYSGYINELCIGGKYYKIKAEVVELYPTTCKKCGGSFKLHHGEGECPFCHTNYTTMYKIIESDCGE